jgi:hypothetical protein
MTRSVSGASKKSLSGVVGVSESGSTMFYLKEEEHDVI